MVGLFGLLAGCAATGDIDLADRCASLMQQAFPGGDITVTKRRAFDDKDPNYDTIVAEVEGVRRDVSTAAPIARQVAVRCRFTDGILTGFRWTRGPLQRTASGQR